MFFVFVLGLIEVVRDWKRNVEYFVLDHMLPYSGGQGTVQENFISGHKVANLFATKIFLEMLPQAQAYKPCI